jgi:cytochrome c-type protein NapB
LQIIVAIALAVGGVGLVAGVRGTGREVRPYVSPKPQASSNTETRSYVDMRDSNHGPNADVQASWWSPQPVDVFAPVVQTMDDRTAALARRATRRAFNGAPPTIPHTIDQRAVPACLTCHEEGRRIANLVAPKMSHRPLGSCVQCHVVSTDPRPGAATPPAPETTFVGLAAPTGGERAWAGAPPTIPHTTWMREKCDSCHGVFGALGMRSTHPWRVSCTQCHAPSAVLDQRPPVVIGGVR